MLAWFMLGCSLKSSVSMLQMDQQYDTLNTPKNRESQFEWSMAEEYRNKAKEEYASSQFQDAETLAEEAVAWMNKAAETASSQSGDSTEIDTDPNVDGAEQ